MKDTSKKYWKGIEELSNDPEFLKHANNEFPDFLSVKESQDDDVDSGTDRRDFLKLLGFGVAAVSLAACEAPVKRVIPYVNKPEDVDPGIANWYASTYMNEGEYCSILVKTREGRPIKIEGNVLSGVTKGGTSARVQASILSLYDEERLKTFLKDGAEVIKDDYKALDQEIISGLSKVQESGKGIRIISPTIMSPSTKRAIEEFKSRFPATTHIMYDAVSASGMIKANESVFGQAVIPSYDFSKAKVIVSFGADFLGTWIAPVEFARQYAATRKLGKGKKEMSRHYQFESNLSMTGSNADIRVPVTPSQEAILVAELYNLIAAEKINTPSLKNDVVAKVAQELQANRGNSLVVSGSNDPNIQMLVNRINLALENYGTTIDLSTPSYQRQGDDAAMNAFVDDLKGDKIGAAIFYGSNPVYSHPRGAEISASLSKADIRISFSDRLDETALLANYVLPDLHYLESWNDAEPKKGFYSLAQPTISPIFKGTRSAQESLLIWAGNKQDYYTYVQETWKGILSGDAQWDKVLHDGVYEPGKDITAPELKDGVRRSMPVLNPYGITTAVGAAGAQPSAAAPELSAIADSINRNYKAGDGLELKLYEKVSIGSGAGVNANNPWLHEMPDPVSKATWDNYLAVSQRIAAERGLKQGDLVSISANGTDTGIIVPVIIQPGQANGSVSLALGYGRTNAGKCGNNVGANAWPLVSVKDGFLVYSASNIDFAKTGGVRKIAQTQTHHTIMARPVIQDATFAQYQKDAGAGRFKPMVHTSEGPKKPKDVTVWYEHDKPNHLWGMVIDLNSCIGCGSCVIGCQVENNVPVVGRKEVLARREMHWIRIDRYYSSDAEVQTEDPADKYFKHEGGVKDLEIAAENPQVTFQPMLCQQCNHAPCETVCPVAATTHSSEGLNQMTYNRCIGTRYCANNCPYKVRRFNWFKYHDHARFPENITMNNALGKMVLNPDVTVRSRGVMEKCTFCVQRIQEGKLQAKREKRRPVDGEIVTACASACPTQAITFGDMNDPESAVSKQLREENEERAYTVLEEINTQPNINYLTKIRNI